MSIHDGHRARLRKRFIEHGAESMEDHQILEMLLFYSIPRGDTNELAHALMAAFGSFSAVLEASATDLCRVPGIGMQSATMLSFMGSVVRRYLIDKNNQNVTIIGSVTDCTDYLQPYFAGRKNETVYILCLDAKCKVLSCKQIGEGSINSAAIPLRRVVDIALSCNASSVVLAHNHPGGIALPSKDDISTTKQIAAVLKSVDVILADHIVYSDDDCVSMYQSGLFKPDMHITVISG